MNWVDAAKGKAEPPAPSTTPPSHRGHAPRHRGPARRKKDLLRRPQHARNQRAPSQRLFASGLTARLVNLEWKLPNEAERYSNNMLRGTQAKHFHLLALLLSTPAKSSLGRDLPQAWDAETFFDFDHSLGTAVNKIREALNDAADNPRYIETLPNEATDSSADQLRTARGHDRSGCPGIRGIRARSRGKAWTDRKWRLSL